MNTLILFILSHLYLSSVYAQDTRDKIVEIKNINVIFIDQEDFAKEQMKDRLKKAETVLKQCGIIFKKINFISLDQQPNKINYLDTNKMISLFHNLNLNFNYDRSLTIYILTEFLGKEFATGKSYAEWIDLNYDSTEQDLRNTIWLASKTISNFENEKKYSIIAHELVHTLTKRGSHYSPNPAHQLSTTYDRTDLILESHCIEMRENIITNKM